MLGLGKTIGSLFIQLIVVVALGAGGWWTYQNRESLPFIDGAGGETDAKNERPPTPVDIAGARLDSVLVTLEAIGTARANESITMMSDEMGLVSKIHFSEGAQVNEGDILVSLDSGIQQAEIEINRAEIAVHQARLENARQLYARAERLRQSQNVPEARVDELAANLKAAEAEVKRWEAALTATRVRLSKREVRAPFSGRLGMRNISVGALVEPGDPIVTLDDITTIKLDFQVPERNLAHLQPSQEVTAETDAYPGRIFFGRVAAIDSRIDAVTRAVSVRALIDNADEALKPGMFLLVELGVSIRHQAVIIPEEAVVANGTQQYVFIVDEGQARQSSVELGQRMVGEVEVVSGVLAGEAIIVGGVQKVRDGASVAPRPPAAEAVAAQ